VFEVRAYTSSHSTSPFCEVFFFFQDRVSQTIGPGWLRTSILLIPASWVTRITGMNHQCPAHFSFLTSSYVSTFWLPNSRWCELLWKVLLIKPEYFNMGLTLKRLRIYTENWWTLATSIGVWINEESHWITYFWNIFKIYGIYFTEMLFMNIILTRRTSSNVSDMQQSISLELFLDLL
jgi:hypothetical protein